MTITSVHKKYVKEVWVYVLEPDRRTSYNDKKRPIRVKIGSKCSKAVSLEEATDLVRQLGEAINDVITEQEKVIV